MLQSRCEVHESYPWKSKGYSSDPVCHCKDAEPTKQKVKN